MIYPMLKCDAVIDFELRLLSMYCSKSKNDIISFIHFFSFKCYPVITQFIQTANVSHLSAEDKNALPLFSLWSSARPVNPPITKTTDSHLPEDQNGGIDKINLNEKNMQREILGNDNPIFTAEIDNSKVTQF